MASRVEMQRVRYRMELIAELIANGMPVHDAGRQLGLSRGQTARAWANICAELGPQAC